MKEYDIAQIPVIEDGNLIGSVKEDRLIHLLIREPSAKSKPVRDVMDAAFPLVDADTSIAEISALLTKENPAVLTKNGGGKYEILTKADLIRAIAR